MEHATSTIPAVETWRPIRDFENLYEVSSLGRVRSLDRYYPDAIVTPDGKLAPYVRKGKILKGFVHPTGYVTICLRAVNIQKTVLLHRIVAEAFVPNPDNLPEINHKDEDKTNNRADNLEWCDSKYNKHYGTARERINQKRCKPIEQLTLDGQHVAFYSSVAEAVRMSEGKFGQPHIYGALKGNQKTAYGYQWRYVNEPINQIENGQPLSI